MKKEREDGHLFPDSLPAKSAKPLYQGRSSCRAAIAGQLTFVGPGNRPCPLVLQTWGQRPPPPCPCVSLSFYLSLPLTFTNSPSLTPLY